MPVLVVLGTFSCLQLVHWRAALTSFSGLIWMNCDGWVDVLGCYNRSLKQKDSDFTCSQRISSSDRNVCDSQRSRREATTAHFLVQRVCQFPVHDASWFSSALLRHNNLAARTMDRSTTAKVHITRARSPCRGDRRQRRQIGYNVLSGLNRDRFNI